MCLIFQDVEPMCLIFHGVIKKCTFTKNPGLKIDFPGLKCPWIFTSFIINYKTEYHEILSILKVSNISNFVLCFIFIFVPNLRKI